MAPLTGVTMVQRMTYRGDNTEEWSNNYHFRDAPPSTSADWDTLVNALAQIVKPVIPNTIEIVRAYGYNDDSDKPVSVYAKDWLTEGAPIAGTFAPGVNDHHMSGDQAYYATWQLDSRNARGKWIYLRKYLHGGIVAPTNPDIPDNAYRGAVDTYARALGTPAGGFHGGLRSRKTSAPILWTGTSDYITTRTLKRRVQVTNSDITGGSFEDGYWVCKPLAELEMGLKMGYYLTKSLRILEELAALGAL